MDTINPNFDRNLLILGNIVLFFQCVFAGGGVSSRRSKSFTKDFLKEKIAEPSNNKVKPAAGGYPDMGNGLYSDHLDFAQWMKFNQAQRIHQNFVEWITIFVVLLWICHFFYPRTAWMFNILFIVGRALYRKGYNKQPKSRILGALSFILGTFVLIGVVGYGIATKGNLRGENGVLKGLGLSN